MAKLTLYPSAELHARLVQLAESERRSVNAQTLMLLETAIGPYQITSPIPDAADTVWTAVSGLAQPKAKSKRASGVTGKVRNYPCEHRRPAGAYCKICDSEDAK
jgi:hypothetical protein